VGEFLDLTSRKVAGIVLELSNADSDERSHPRNLRLAAERAYPGPLANKAGDLMADAVEMLFREQYIKRDYADVVDHDWFKFTPKGKSITQREQIEEPAALLSTDRPLVFISCGQYSDSEKAVGKRIVELINEHTDYIAYFAETQRSFEALSNSILAALQKMSGMVVIMHRRGEVTTPHKHFQRGSVWIEQEIAIAASLKHAGHNIEVIAYIQDGIEREGLRDLLHLNPVIFRNDDEIATDFERLLKSGEFRLEKSQPQALPENLPPAEVTNPFLAEANKSLNHAAGQGGLMIPSFICSMSLVVHPSTYRPNRFTDDEIRGVVDIAKGSAGKGFPFQGPEHAVNLVGGFQVTTVFPWNGHAERREYYRFLEDGLFTLTRVSENDIGQDHQFLNGDWFIGFGLLVTTLTQMSRFAAALSKIYANDTTATFRVNGLANHRLADDGAERLLMLGNISPSHVDRIEATFTGSPEQFEAERDEWAADTAVKCLRVLNYSATTPVAKRTVREYQKKLDLQF
jgi:hypothetical protein